MNPRSKLREPLAVLAALAVLAGCSGAPDDATDAPPIAVVDADPVPRAELDAYLQITLGDEAGEASDRVKSELLDQMLVYRLVETEATRAGHTVDAEEVERRLRVLGLDDGGPEGEDVAENFRRLLRRSILVDRFLAENVVGDVEVTAEEMKKGSGSGEAVDLGPQVVYRQAMTSTLDEAREIMERVTRDKEPFAQVAAEVSLSPDGAQPLLARVGQLPPEVGKVLGGGPKGGVVGPVPVECGLEEYPDACRYYVFLIEDREDTGRSSEPTTEEVRESVRRGKQSERLAAYLEELRRSGRIEVLAENLPFDYAHGEIPEEEM